MTDVLDAKARPVAPPVETPVAIAESTRAVAEETGDAVAAAGDAIAQTTPSPAPASTKGLLDMATTFDTSAFTPSPEKFQSLFGDFQTRAKTGLEKGAKVVEELGDFTRGNVEAFMASGRAAASGAETLGQDAVSYGRRSVEELTAAIKGFAGAKSPTELFKLQSDYARVSFENAVAEGSKFSEAWLKLAGEIAQPLSSRVAVAAEKIKAPLAS